MLTIYFAPLVCIAGALVYGFAGNVKAQELGKLAYFAGLLVSLFLFAHGNAVHIP